MEEAGLTVDGGGLTLDCSVRQQSVQQPSIWQTLSNLERLGSALSDLLRYASCEYLNGIPEDSQS